MMERKKKREKVITGKKGGVWSDIGIEDWINITLNDKTFMKIILLKQILSFIWLK